MDHRQVKSTDSGEIEAEKSSVMRLCIYVHYMYVYIEQNEIGIYITQRRIVFKTLPYMERSEATKKMTKETRGWGGVAVGGGMDGTTSLATDYCISFWVQIYIYRKIVSLSFSYQPLMAAVVVLGDLLFILKSH